MGAMRLGNNSMIKVIEGKMYLDGIPASLVLESISPPACILFTRKLRENCESFKNVVTGTLRDAKIHYSAKTNYSKEVLEIVHQSGLMVQVVSPRELRKVLEAGFPPGSIMVDGLYRQHGFLERAASLHVASIVTPWADELERLDRIARETGNQGGKMQVGLRFMTPSPQGRIGINATDNAAMDRLVDTLTRCDHLQVSMVACHPGSQVHDPHTHGRTCSYLLDAMDCLEARGIECRGATINLGGGFPEPEIATREWLTRVMGEISRVLMERHEKGTRAPTCFEPGRYIVSDAGAIMSRIQRLFHDRQGNRWALLDVGMDVISRFSNSHHRYFSVEHAGEPHGTPLSFQGRVPTAQDVLRKGAHFCKAAIAGEHVLILNCGAYSWTFSRRFSFEYPQRIIIDGDALRAGETPSK